MGYRERHRGDDGLQTLIEANQHHHAHVSSVPRQAPPEPLQRTTWYGASTAQLGGKREVAGYMDLT